MLIRISAVVVLLIAAATASAQDLSTDKEKLSYAIGSQYGAGLKGRSEEINLDSVVLGLRDAFSEGTPRVSLEEMRTLLTAFQEKIRAEEEAALKELAAANKIRSEEFLRNNRSKTGITVLESGVQYRIIEDGEGPRPNLDDVVDIHYRGSNMEGFEFDSSFVRGVPQRIKISDVSLLGWQEVLPLMKVGATWQIFVPPELAFGERLVQRGIGPNEALKFDIKLVQIVEE